MFSTSLFVVQAAKKDKATQKLVSRIATKDKAIKIMLEKAQSQTNAITNMMETCVDGLEDCSQGDAKVAAHPKGVCV